MKNILKLFLPLSIILLNATIFTAAARADYAYHQAILACDAPTNRFIIRFGLIHNEDTFDKAELSPAPSIIEEAWKSMRLAPTGSCKLSDGRNISVSSLSSQSFSYGAGGGAPSVDLTLKIDHKPVYYRRQFYSGYGIGEMLINGIYYDGKNLIEDASARLTSDYALLPAEEEAKSIDARRESMEQGLSAFCKEIKPFIAKDAPYSKAEKIPSGFLSNLKTDINNDGKIDNIYRIGGGSYDCGEGCGNHYFDGSYLIAFVNAQEKIPLFLETMRQKEFNVDVEPSIKEIKEWDALFISQSLSGNSARYIYNTPLAYKGKNYISTFEVSEKAIPRRSVNELTRDNQLIARCEYP